MDSFIPSCNWTTVQCM